MPNTYEASKILLHDLHSKGFVPGANLQARSPFTNLILAGLALDSDTLDVQAVVMDPESKGFMICKPDSITLEDTDAATKEKSLQLLASSTPMERLAAQGEAGYLPEIDKLEPRDLAQNGTLSGFVTRHFKGGVYTVFAALGVSSPDPIIVYISHADGTWWTRSWSEFSDGRFDPSEASPLTKAEMGLDTVYAKVA